MEYISTRGLPGAPTASFSHILLEGLAADGGLYVPARYPQLDEQILEDWRAVLATAGYSTLAQRVLQLFIDDIPADDLLGICRRAYTTEKFGRPSIVPVDRIGDGPLWIGHLSNGPTAAFKDMAMQLLGEFFEYELARRDGRLTILGATSGDTGSSAEYAMRGRDRISVYMLTPAGRMTPFQQAQMFSLSDPNIHNIAVDGVFDDCQDIVKAVNADAGFKAAYRIGAVNSINWARLVAQVVYYVALWLRVTTRNDQRISFAVPSGNFGNICAGHVARQMGLPIDALILATNENDVLHEFFQTGVYRVRQGSEVAATSSPSMDISKASNFERFVFDLLGRDGARVAELFGERLARDGRFDLSQTPEFAQLADRYGFISGSSTHADRLETIRGLWENNGVLIDPHTADGVHVAHQWLRRVNSPIVVLETALPVKFAETIHEAVGVVPEVPARFAGILDAPRRVVELPNDPEAIKRYIAEHEPAG
ncbi:MAG: threonine synthase [Brooklawnia sp.]|uniref:threonine synthase n=1 Tax=Brooklawnia sp. TaxID=2699740 RepID=UPI003C78A62E